jgi:phage terminase large subunit
MWAPDYQREFERRLENVNHLRSSVPARLICQAYYANNCEAWINDWAVTFDPRNKPPLPRLLPFKLFPRQVDFVHFILSCLEDKESGLVEKSRDMGATWLCCAISVWLWLYRPGTVIGWGSRKESYVDKMGDPKAIFPKMRQIIENLPAFMLPVGFSITQHATYMRIINPVNLSAITGEAGDSMGRGGRTSIYFKDESAHYERPELIEAALGDNTDVQIDMSSVNGSANIFYRKRMAGEVWVEGVEPTPGKTRVFIFDWRENPLKTLEWYEARRAKAEAEGLLHIFAQEVDRDYSGSVERIIIRPEWVAAAVDAHIKLGFEADGLKVAGQDVADGGGDKNAIAVAHGVVLRYCDHWGGEAGEAAKVAVPLCVEYQVSELYYDSVGVGSGFKTGINNMREREGFPPHLRVLPWNGGAEVLEPTDHIIPGDDQSPTNEDQYANLKAQAWFRLRARFYKTFRAVVHGEKYPFEELISIDSTIARRHELQMELSQAVHKYNPKGKTLVDKKPDGALSPNLADAVAIAYSPTREISILDVL